MLIQLYSVRGKTPVNNMSKYDEIKITVDSIENGLILSNQEISRLKKDIKETMFHTNDVEIVKGCIDLKNRLIVATTKPKIRAIRENPIYEGVKQTPTYVCTSCGATVKHARKYADADGISQFVCSKCNLPLILRKV